MAMIILNTNTKSLSHLAFSFWASTEISTAARALVTKVSRFTPPAKIIGTSSAHISASMKVF